VAAVITATKGADRGPSREAAPFACTAFACLDAFETVESANESSAEAITLVWKVAPPRRQAVSLPKTCEQNPGLHAASM